MSNFLKKKLTESEIFELINGDHSEIDSESEDSDENIEILDEEDLPIDHTVAPGLPHRTVSLDHDILNDAEQVTDTSTAKMDIKWR
jgi:hypothetical protein